MTTGKNQFTNQPAAAVLYSGKDGGSATRGINSVVGDGNFSDLICHPFKDVRDAARRFITRLDFTRGDRVVLVTFGAEAKLLTPYGATLPVISKASDAITTLNMQAGVEVEPSHINMTCASIFGGIPNNSGGYTNDIGTPNYPYLDWGGQLYPPNQYYLGDNGSNVTNYWTAAQCNDTNTGAGIATATNALVDPRYIRRDAVWVMVLLSSGYPNRTPPVGTFGIGLGPSTMSPSTKYTFFYGGPNPVVDEITYKDDPCNPAHSSPPDAFYNNCCEGTNTVPKGANFGTANDLPQYCADMNNPRTNGAQSGWGWKFTDPLNPGTYGQIEHGTDPVVPAANNPPLFSFGFCPTVNINYPLAATIHANFYTLPTGVHTDCNNPDPDARHFCMDSNGGIFPPSSTNPYQCDTYYDPMDYARDRVDFSALDNYTNNQKGNFISMYSIYFAHQTKNGQLDDDILGVKFMRYVADAGDNGKIDNPIQRWYRDQRDLNVNPPPTGGDGIAATTGCAAPATTCTNPTQSLTLQALLPYWSATNPGWTNAPYKYSTGGDPCAVYDYFYNPAATGGPNTYGVNAQGDTFLNENGSAAEKQEYQVKRAQQNCGQYFYATNKTLNQAFAAIASRLFTRLTQ